jgi:hypothetical protein
MTRKLEHLKIETRLLDEKFDHVEQTELPRLQKSGQFPDEHVKIQV